MWSAFRTVCLTLKRRSSSKATMAALMHLLSEVLTDPTNGCWAARMMPTAVSRASLLTFPMRVEGNCSTKPWKLNITQQLTHVRGGGGASFQDVCIYLHNLEAPNLIESSPEKELLVVIQGLGWWSRVPARPSLTFMELRHASPKPMRPRKKSRIWSSFCLAE